MGKSIYVAIPCLGVDHELPKTINWCLTSQSGENEIIVHAAIIDRKDYYDHVSSIFAENKNVIISYHDIENNFGVGRGRTLAAERYNGEDYFLQIDSHTLFHKNWDSRLIEKFELAKKTLNNNKIVISANLPAYCYKDAQTIEHESEMMYPIYENDLIDHVSYVIPKANHQPISQISPFLYQKLKSDGFVPLNKISAQFVFSDIEFAKNRCLDDNIIFWEEESIQSIELLNNGFYLVFADDLELLMNHKVPDYVNEEKFYSLDNRSREDNAVYSHRVGKDEDWWSKQIVENYKQYILNNSYKIDKYTKYCKTDITYRQFSHFNYPLNYNF